MAFGNSLEGDIHVEAVSIAIHRELNLMIEAKRGLLVNDLKWWKRKHIFKPELFLNKECQQMLVNLNSRIDSLTQLLNGRVSEELSSLR